MVGFLGSKTEKGHWSHPPDFWLSCLGYTIGFGNIWRFPYLVYRNGGGAFMVPYFFFMIILGIPALFFEMSLGQFTSQGILTCWKCVPIFKGLGFGMALINFYFGIYYSILVAYCIYYLFTSFTSELPWVNCKQPYSSSCTDDFIQSLPKMLDMECRGNGHTVTTNGFCMKGTEIIGITGSWGRFKSPAREFLYDEVLQSSGYGLDDLGPIRWKLVLCNGAVFALCAICLFLGVKVFGKVVWVTAGVPLVLLVVFLIKGLTLDNSSLGREFFITENFERLSDLVVWRDAGVQVFYSLSLAMGGWITLGSYNRFNTNPMYTSMLVSVFNSLASIIAGFMIFSFIGYGSLVQGVSVHSLLNTGPSLVFVTMPEIFSKMSDVRVYSILFFLMLFFFGFTTQLFLIETNITAILDQLPVLRTKRPFVVIGYCVVLFLLSLTMTTSGGSDMMSWIDVYSSSFNILLLCAAQCIVVTFIYGICRFLSDIESMVGQRVFFIIPWSVIKIVWALMWMAVVPIASLFLFGVEIEYYTRLDFWPEWSEILGWMMRVSSIAVICAVCALMIFIQIITRKNIVDLFRPADDWGPASDEDRQKASLLNPCIKVQQPSFVGLQTIEGQVPVVPPSYAGNIGQPAYGGQDVIKSTHL